jgi:formyl-CoA transferase
MTPLTTCWYVFYMLGSPDGQRLLLGSGAGGGRQNLIEDPRFASESGRRNHAEELFEIMKDWTKSRDKRKVMAAFAEEGVPCGAVFDTHEVITQPHLIEREIVREIEHPARGKYVVIGCPVRLSGSPVEVTRAPFYGEHSDEVFISLGGLTQAEADQLRRENVIV